MTEKSTDAAIARAYQSIGIDRDSFLQRIRELSKVYNYGSATLRAFDPKSHVITDELIIRLAAFPKKTLRELIKARPLNAAAIVGSIPSALSVRVHNILKIDTISYANDISEWTKRDFYGFERAPNIGIASVEEIIALKVLVEGLRDKSLLVKPDAETQPVADAVLSGFPEAADLLTRAAKLADRPAFRADLEQLLLRHENR